MQGRVRLVGPVRREAPLRDGGAAFAALPPAEYELVVEAPGFEPLSRKVAVGRDEHVALRAQLAPAGGAAESRLAETARFRDGLGSVFDAAALASLPAGGDVFSLLETAETATIADRIDGGGLFAGEAGRVTAHGASWTQARWRWGDLDLTDPEGGGVPLVLPDAGVLDEVAADTGLHGAAQGSAGPSIRLQPRRFDDAWSGALRATSSLGEAAAAGAIPPAARLLSWRGIDGHAGGAIGGSRVQLAASHAAGRREQAGDVGALSSRRSTLQGQLAWSAGPRDALSGMVLTQWARRPSASRAWFADAGLEEAAEAIHGQLAWSRAAAGGSVTRVSGGGTRATASSAPGTLPGTVERLQAGPIPALAPPGRAVRSRLDLELRHALAPLTSGPLRHLAAVGAAATHASFRLTPSMPGVSAGESVDGLPARAWDVWLADDRRSGTDWALHATDRILAGERWTLDAGLRATQSSARADAATAGIRWRTLEPRLQARVRITDGVSAFAGYARYGHRLPLRLAAWGDTAAPRADVSLWNDADRDGRFQAAERGTLVARAGPGAPVGSLDPELRSPRVDEFSVGVEARIGAALHLSLVGIDRQEARLVESVNVGVPPDSYRVLALPDPSGDILGPADDQLLPLYLRSPSTYGQDRFVLTNPPGLDGFHQAAEFTLAGRWPRLWFRLGATAHRSVGSNANRGFRPQENDQALVGELFDQPNAGTFSRGRLFSDRAYTIKLWAGGRAPAGVRLDAVARYQDGQPFARVVIADLGVGPEPVQAIPNGRARFTYTLTLDARAEREWRLGRAGVSLALEAFNLLGTAHEVEEDVVTGPAYRTPTLLQPPRVLRAGVSLRY